MVKVLVADDDLDVHELVHDILLINFQDVKIDWALNEESLHNKLKESQPPYNLILFSVDSKEDRETLAQIRRANPEMIERIVLLTEKHDSFPDDPALKAMPQIAKPFSLDHFGDIVKKTCVTT